MKKIILVFVLFCSFSNLIKANPLILPKDSLNKPANLHVIFEYQLLRSTHSTKFKGVNFIFSKSLSVNKSLGLGIEYSYAPFHGDNGYHLYQLNFIPVYLDFRYHFNQKRLSPFVIVDAGYSFVNYRRELIGFPSSRKRIKEGGIYLQGDFGLSYKINKDIQPILSVGFKGFHNSFNNLDINPHGLILRAGVQFNL
ncbi:MAG: hypothetical protein KKE39_05800 [Bacteroidetes bacterium]|nr:hypothetical protein [Bacteroidota bacterium]MBU1371651.1 hypothetical protein [Bacteroidota bacterium]MBU1486227.1 hypothetical protein [Bacteroidota bacterium]MBU1761117.1 hypothetical protein [Bacteroidota bacterium]MBU2267486.1 hypothetical protein [Bacteroidota bacterium]